MGKNALAYDDSWGHEKFQEGREVGYHEGESRLAQLLKMLYAANREDDAKRAVSNEDTRAKLFAEMGL